jgi:hypothetical protein
LFATTIFVPALWVASGVSLFAGVHFASKGLLRRQERVFLAFGILCLLGAGYILLSAQWYRATSAIEASWILRIQMSLVCLVYPVFVWFAALYTGQPASRGWLASVSVSFGALLAMNLWSPASFLYAEVTQGEPLALPWGEVVSYFSMRTAPVALFYYAITYAVFSWAIYRCVLLWRQGQWRRAAPFAAFLLIQFATIVYAEVIDNMGVRGIYLADFAFLALVVLMSACLGQELNRRSAALEASVTTLRAETERRRLAEEQLRHMAYHDYLTDFRTADNCARASGIPLPTAAVPGVMARCCCSTSITSRPSTTPSGTSSGMSCCGRLPDGSAARCPAPRRRCASGAMSLRYW